MKILTIIGARPQFIKAGTLSRKIKSHNDIKEIIVHTGQHYDKNMSDIFFEEMNIPKPHYHLGVSGMGHGEMTGKMLEKIETVLLLEKPDWVVLYGDTNSTLAGALAASKLHIKVAHIEAGLRSFNINMPEEINRILTDRISSLLLCPTQTSMNNLKKEGIDYWKPKPKSILVGDIMQDGAFYYSKLAVKPKDFKYDEDYILCTIHRAENTDDLSCLKSIIDALRIISKSKRVVLPLHPRTKKIIYSNNIDLSGLDIIDPVGYLNMIWLIKNSSYIMTDSGGLQKEAFFFEKPCITLRDETEWIELVECGVNFLTGANTEAIIKASIVINNSEFKYNQEIYGNGNASEIIINNLKRMSK